MFHRTVTSSPSELSSQKIIWQWRCTTILWNAGNCSTNGTVSHPI